MAIAASNATVSAVDAELGSLVSADLPAVVDRVALRVVMAARAARAAALHVPPSRRVGNNVVAVRPFLHVKLPCVLQFRNASHDEIVMRQGKKTRRAGHGDSVRHKYTDS